MFSTRRRMQHHNQTAREKPLKKLRDADFAYANPPKITHTPIITLAASAPSTC